MSENEPQVKHPDLSAIERRITINERRLQRLEIEALARGWLTLEDLMQIREQPESGDQ